MRGDINLLPKKKASGAGKLATSFILVIIAILIFSGLYMVYLPNKYKKDLEKQIASKEAELASYTVTEDEYTELSARLALLRDRMDEFDRINAANLQKSIVLSEVESAIPTSINLSSFSITGGNLSISGTTTSPDPVLISQFMVNLRNIEKVTNVTLSSINNSEEGYSFSLTIDYDIDLPEEEQETREEGAS
ncbi:MAG: PilN domain-containing protein [Clostridiales bacterium]|nr:PilN domain-containing protein [Clostridiales bacterium]